MARERKEVALKRQIEGPSGQITKVVVQEPTAADFFALGAPQTWVRASGGMALIDNDVAIRAYAERLIVEPDPLVAMNHMSVLDAIAVKNAIVGFFQEPPAAE